MRRECYKDVGRIFDDFRHKKKIFSCERAKKIRANFFSYDASASRAYASRPRPIRANEIRLGEIVTRVVLELLRRGAGWTRISFLAAARIATSGVSRVMLQRLPVLLAL